MKLKDKKVLFLSAFFFGYNQEICNAMRQMGAIVDYFDERPKNSFLVKALIRLRPELLKSYIDKYHDNIIKTTAQNKYDYIFIIKAESISIDSLEKLKKNHTNAKLVLYLWDSFDNFKNGAQKLPLFDRALSFDKKDCEQYSMIFRPLFYTTAYQAISDSVNEADIDVIFIGTMHSDRYKFVKKIEYVLNSYGKKVYLYLFFMSKVLYYKMKYFDKGLDGTTISDFYFEPISQKNIIELYKRVFAVLDIQHPKQTGLTMRTFEVLGASRKLITTNSDVVNYDFYNPNNILVVDRYNPKIDKAFFETKYEDLSEIIYNKYSIRQWIRDIFDI